ncbi:hypothetical protein EYF80_007703 [Liparis tanakae]|uniref:Uncharacterized protein n=1 Tax=Liparis tanakae TaxID=230148 RepID=A0A4Z2IWC6_9TELE|nr:hypothetical protein EYF80_007703 [Liparis tanakae]
MCAYTSENRCGRVQKRYGVTKERVLVGHSGRISTNGIERAHESVSVRTETMNVRNSPPRRTAAVLGEDVAKQKESPGQGARLFVPTPQRHGSELRAVAPSHGGGQGTAAYWHPRCCPLNTPEYHSAS